MSDAGLCRELGERGAEAVSGITWDGILDELLQWVERGR
jgi:hypothetical protein